LLNQFNHMSGRYKEFRREEAAIGKSQIESEYPSMFILAFGGQRIDVDHLIKKGEWNEKPD
jgi:hypothetical protein